VKSKKMISLVLGLGLVAVLVLGSATMMGCGGPKKNAKPGGGDGDNDDAMVQINLEHLA
jgi:hypothetical protein